jgi:hypothetical protein
VRLGTTSTGSTYGTGGEEPLFCSCGAGGSTERLDAHLLAVFTPADGIGLDRLSTRDSDPL